MSTLGKLIKWLLALIVACPLSAQTFQFWPEVNTFLKVNDGMRLSFTASQTRESGSSTEGEVGPSVDFFLKPLFRLKRIVVFQLDPAKARPLMFRLGYRFLPSTKEPLEHRIVIEATPRYPLRGEILLTNRNRADLRFIAGRFSWRYRNRLSAERTFTLGKVHVTPYARAEAYFDSNYSTFSRVAISAGSIFPIREHVELEGYFEHRNDTGKNPNHRLYAVGAILNLYF